jgi:hypothetical protein
VRNTRTFYAEQRLIFSWFRLTQRIEFIDPPPLGLQVFPQSDNGPLPSDYEDAHGTGVPAILTTSAQEWKERKYPPFFIKGTLFHTEEVEYECEARSCAHNYAPSSD